MRYGRVRCATHHGEREYMLNKTIPVGVDGSSATITSYAFAPTEDAYALKPMPAVVVVPGGGYDHVSPREGEPVALRLLAMGYQAFVLNYSVAPAVYPLEFGMNSRERSIPSEAMRQSIVSILIGLRSWVFRPAGTWLACSERFGTNPGLQSRSRHLLSRFGLTHYAWAIRS